MIVVEESSAVPGVMPEDSVRESIKYGLKASKNHIHIEHGWLFVSESCCTNRAKVCVGVVEPVLFL